MAAAPADPRNFPDPFVLPTLGGYLAFATNGAGSNVQVMSSRDLGQWHTEPDALPALPAWAAPGFTWAPAILPRPGGYVCFYTVREPRAGRQAISAAVSSTPGGPYLDASTGPLVYQLGLGGSIDPSPFVDTDGTPYLLWKADANAIGKPSSLWICQLSADGQALTGTPARLLGYDAAWEDPLVEAPSLVRHGGAYYLFYSANWWNTPRYAIGYATSAALRGPYTKATAAGPWFGADTEVAGPGGQEWFHDRAGQLRMAYHGWEPGRVGYPGGARSLRLAAVSFIGGRPVASP